jgi:hypothetical protein
MVCPSAAIGANIENTAHIYFDNNEAVVTNTTDHRVFDCATFQPQLEYNNGVLSTVEGMSYQWYYNAMPLAGSNGATLDVVGEGTYCVTVQHPLGCIADQQCELVADVPDVVGSTLHLAIAPHASGNGYMVSSSELLEYVKLYDPSGRLVFERRGLHQSSMHVSIDLTVGCYVIECRGESGRVGMAKLMVAQEKD